MKRPGEVRPAPGVEMVGHHPWRYPTVERLRGVSNLKYVPGRMAVLLPNKPVTFPSIVVFSATVSNDIKTIKPD